MIAGFIGTSELLLIAALALLLVGGKKLPEMMRGLGKGIREFKEGMKDMPEQNNDAQSEDVTANNVTTDNESKDNSSEN